MEEPHRTPPDLLVLHTLRCIGSASTQRLRVAVTQVEDADVEGHLLALATRGLVTHLPGDFGGWFLTEAGKAADAERVAAELDAAGARADVRAAYEDFLPLNQRVLEVCSAWQIRDGGGAVVLNDHSDRRYDAGVLDRLGALNGEAQEVCARLGAQLHRFSRYGPSLAAALERARGGELELVTDSVDSYHAVWFQLHEDLLVSLGLSRDW